MYPSADSTPAVSVVLPAFNSSATCKRAIVSVLNQTFTGVALLIIDDWSTDYSRGLAEEWAARDQRVRTLVTPEQSGAAAARNIALREVRGEWVAYCDADDEYHPDYLAHLAAAADTADVLISGYDLIYNAGTQQERVTHWEPAAVKHLLFAKNIAVPLGVAHRRDLIDRIGGFNELIPVEADWDYWKRLARAGAKFRFLPISAGRYHVRPDSLSRKPHVPAPMKRRLLANRAARRPLYDDGQPPVRPPKVQKLAFASAHCLIDFGSGAAVATSRQFRFLQSLGFACRAYCGSTLDTPGEELVEELLARGRTHYEVQKTDINGYPARLLSTRLGDVPVMVFLAASTRGRWAGDAEATAFLDGYARFLEADCPDAVLTYGGDPVTRAMVELTKRLDIPVVFGLHNLAYDAPEAFSGTDYAVVPSEFARTHYWDKLGLDCAVLPNAVDDESIRVRARRPEFVTFVNPVPAKGVFVFAAIAAELARRRPEIPLLVVESRGQAESLKAAGLDLASLGNVHLMPSTPRPADFYERTKVLLVPSLAEESFGLVAAEALLNGIPVLASRRGALPEVVGECGLLLNSPDSYTADSREAPRPEDIEPWVEAILHLWDDPQVYAEASYRACRHAERWHEDRLAPLYRDFFASLTPQPVPPLAPAGVR